jgi:hypothetical protein
MPALARQLTELNAIVVRELDAVLEPEIEGAASEGGART